MCHRQQLVSNKNRKRITIKLMLGNKEHTYIHTLTRARRATWSEDSSWSIEQQASIIFGIFNMYPTITNSKDNNNSGNNAATFEGLFLKKSNRSLGCSKGDVPQRRMPSFSDPTSKAHTHTHAYANTEQKKNETKNEDTHLAPLPQCYAEAATRDLGSKVLPKKKRNRPTRTKKEKTQERTSTCCSVVSHPGWPRVTWYGMPSHFVPLSQSWGVTSGTYIESQQDKSVQTPKNSWRMPTASSKTSHKNNLPSWPWKSKASNVFCFEKGGWKIGAPRSGRGVARRTRRGLRS